MMMLKSNIIKSQDTRNQYPSVLLNAYFEINLGYINYPFSNASLPKGYTASEITVPHEAVRLTLLGIVLINTF